MQTGMRFTRWSTALLAVLLAACMGTARSVRSPAIRSVDLVAERWLTPLGGDIRIVEGTLALTGSGTAISFGATGAVAILDRPLPTDYVIEGEILIACEWAGFVLSFDPDARTFVSLYAGSLHGSGSGLVTALMTHEGPTRARLQNVPVGWARDEWLRFRLTKVGRQVRFELGNAPAETFTLPANRAKGRFGVAEYNDGAVQLRRLQIRSAN